MNDIIEWCKDILPILLCIICVLIIQCIVCYWFFQLHWTVGIVSTCIMIITDFTSCMDKLEN